MSGKLVLCATPIGNLEDMSPRGIRTLTEADVIACEDTRRTRRLLSHFGIHARDLVSYNDANERRRAPELIERIGGGATVALVSDAGVPGLSDPGYRLVRACGDAGYPVEIVPGPNAAVSALAVSGIAPARFVFEGFLPRKSAERRTRIAELADETRTLVFYESPHRIAATLKDLGEVLGNRPAVLARELTKMHEEVRRGTLAQLLEGVAAHPPPGEIVVVVEGAIHGSKREPPAADLAARARELMDAGKDRRDALAQVARELGVAKRKVFDALLEEKSEDGG